MPKKKQAGSGGLSQFSSNPNITGPAVPDAATRRIFGKKHAAALGATFVGAGVFLSRTSATGLTAASHHASDTQHGITHGGDDDEQAAVLQVSEYAYLLRDLATSVDFSPGTVAALPDGMEAGWIPPTDPTKLQVTIPTSSVIFTARMSKIWGVIGSDATFAAYSNVRLTLEPLDLNQAFADNILGFLGAPNPRIFGAADLDIAPLVATLSKTKLTLKQRAGLLHAKRPPAAMMKKMNGLVDALIASAEQSGLPPEVEVGGSNLQGSLIAVMQNHLDGDIADAYQKAVRYLSRYLAAYDHILLKMAAIQQSSVPESIKVQLAQELYFAQQAILFRGNGFPQSSGTELAIFSLLYRLAPQYLELATTHKLNSIQFN